MNSKVRIIQQKSKAEVLNLALTTSGTYNVLGSANTSLQSTSARFTVLKVSPLYQARLNTQFVKDGERQNCQCFGITVSVTFPKKMIL